MEFIREIDQNKYYKFYKKCSYSHFMQSRAFCNAFNDTRGKEAHYVAMVDDDNNIVAAAALLKKDFFFKISYYYCPRGFIIDYNNVSLLKEFTEGLKKYLKDNHSIYMVINPDYVWQELDDNANGIDGTKNNTLMYDNLISLGYVHQGFVKLYENIECRYTFRRYFKDYKSMEEIDKTINKNFMRMLKRSYYYNLTINLDDNCDGFYELNSSNAIRDGFRQFPDSFYKKLYEYGRKDDNLRVFSAYANLKEIYEKSLSEYEIINNQYIEKKNKGIDDIDLYNKSIRLKNDIDYFYEFKDDTNMKVASFVIGISNKKLWTMYIGNNSLAEHLFAINRLYYETIKYCFDNKFIFMDLYGTVGDPNTNYKNMKTLFEYKKKFGDRYTEYLGEFHLINNKLLYYLLKIYRKIRK